MSKMTATAKWASAVAVLVTLSGLSIAGPVVVTPGSQAGYLYFNPAGASGGASGSQNINVSVASYAKVARVSNPATEAGECFNASSIGQKCKWGDGSWSVYAGPAPSGSNRAKLFTGEADDGATVNWGCYGSWGRGGYEDGLANTNVILRMATESNACYQNGQVGPNPPVAFWTCNDKGVNYWLPSVNELKVLIQSRTLIGGFKATTYWSSTENGASEAWGVDLSQNTTPYNRWNYSWALRCVRGF